MKILKSMNEDIKGKIKFRSLKIFIVRIINFKKYNSKWNIIREWKYRFFKSRKNHIRLFKSSRTLWVIRFLIILILFRKTLKTF